MAKQVYEYTDRVLFEQEIKLLIADGYKFTEGHQTSDGTKRQKVYRRGMTDSVMLTLVTR